MKDATSSGHLMRAHTAGRGAPLTLATTLVALYQGPTGWVAADNVLIVVRGG